MPLLIVVLFGFLAFVVQRLAGRGGLQELERRALWILWFALVAWGGVTGVLSATGLYVSEGFLSHSPGYWLPFVPVVITLILVTSSASLREGLRKLVDRTPPHWFCAIHAVRILAVGSLFKAALGQFPREFAWYVGIPDLLFGLSAVPVTLLVSRRNPESRTLVAWHLAGAMVILVPVLGLMHRFMHDPLFSVLLTLPMVFAPTLVVPLLVMLNLLVAWRLTEHVWRRPQSL